MSFTIDSLSKLNRFLALWDEDRSRKITIKLCAREWLHKLDINRFKKLGVALGECSALKELDLTDNNLAALNLERFKLFCTALAQCKVLQSVDLSKNALGKLGTKEFQMLMTSLYKCKMLLYIKGIKSNGFSVDQKIILNDVLDYHCDNVFQPLRTSLSKMSAEKSLGADSEEEVSLSSLDSTDSEKPRRRLTSH